MKICEEKTNQVYTIKYHAIDDLQYLQSSNIHYDTKECRFWRLNSIQTTCVNNVTMYIFCSVKWKLM